MSNKVYIILKLFREGVFWAGSIIIVSYPGLIYNSLDIKDLVSSKQDGWQILSVTVLCNNLTTNIVNTIQVYSMLTHLYWNVKTLHDSFTQPHWYFTHTHTHVNKQIKHWHTKSWLKGLTDWIIHKFVHPILHCLNVEFHTNLISFSTATIISSSLLCMYILKSLNQRQPYTHTFQSGFFSHFHLKILNIMQYQCYCIKLTVVTAKSTKQ